MTTDADSGGIDTATRRDRNVATVRQVMAAVNAVDGPALGAHLGEDVSYEAPYYQLHKASRDELVQMFVGLGTRFDTLDYQVTEVFPALDPDLVIFEVRGDHPVTGSPKRYQNHYVMFAYFQDGKIVRWVEFSNPKVYEEAMAPPA